MGSLSQGHEQPSTTLNLYTQAPTDYYDTIRRALAALMTIF
jgi:hypothetical protein